MPVSLKPYAGVDALYAPRRTVLDAMLVDAAEGAGARVPLRADRRRSGPRRRRPRWSVWSLRDRGGAIRTERARLVVGADGRGSLVAARVAAPTIAAGAHTAAYAYGYWPAETWTATTGTTANGAVGRGHPDERRPRMRVRRRPAGRARRGGAPRAARPTRSAALTGAARRTAWPTSWRRRPPGRCGSSAGCPRGCVGRTGPGGRWSGTPAGGRTRCPPTASPTRCATPKLLAAAVVAGSASARATGIALAGYQAQRDRSGSAACTRSSTASLPTSGTPPRSAGCCGHCPRRWPTRSRRSAASTRHWPAPR